MPVPRHISKKRRFDGECRASEITFLLRKARKAYTKLLAWPDGEVPRVNGGLENRCARKRTEGSNPSLRQSTPNPPLVRLRLARQPCSSFGGASMKDFADKVAVISGGANGIGLDIGKCLAAKISR